MDGTFDQGPCDGHRHPLPDPEPASMAPPCVPDAEQALGEYVRVGSTGTVGDGHPPRHTTIIYRWQESTSM